MAPDVAFWLTGAGAASASVLRIVERPRLALGLGALFGLAGVAAVVLSSPGLVSDRLGLALSLSAPSRSLLIVGFAALALIVVMAPSERERSTYLSWGLAGLAGMTLLAIAPTLDIAVVILLIGVVLKSGARLGRRLRVPGLAVALLGLGLVFARLQGPTVLARFGAVALVGGLVAAIGAVPYLHELDPDEEVEVSAIPWLAFVGPVIGVAVLEHARSLLPAAGAALGAMLIGLGLLNIAWGTIASWLTESAASAWRYSFIADWGLVLCGFGLATPDGQAAALLILFAMMLGRLPLFLWSQRSTKEKAAPTIRPVNLLVAAVLAGSAPFAGFAARILLVHSATALYWPLALAIAAGLLLWLPGSIRLGRTLGMPKGRRLAGIAVTLAISTAIGLYPQPLLALAGL